MTVRELYDSLADVIEDGYENFEIMFDGDATEYFDEIDIDIDEIHKEVKLCC